MKKKLTITLGEWEAAWLEAAIEKIAASGLYKDEPKAARRHLLRFTLQAVCREIVLGGELEFPLAVTLRHETPGEIAQRLGRVLPDSDAKLEPWLDSLKRLGRWPSE